MKAPSSLTRRGEYRILRDITLHGDVIDLGGSKNSHYHTLFRGNFHITAANLSTASHEADIHCDLEMPLPCESDSYDGIVLMNTLEHIYNVHQLIGETWRIARGGSTIVIAVPFLFPVHPSPNDFWRFTPETLTRLLTERGYRDVHVYPVTSGVFTACYVQYERIFPSIIRTLFFYTLAPLSALCDALYQSIQTMRAKSNYHAEHYATGYVAVAKKPQ
jgi:SAM-dependent methyltransferase